MVYCHQLFNNQKGAPKDMGKEPTTDNTSSNDQAASKDLPAQQPHEPAVVPPDPSTVIKPTQQPSSPVAVSSNDTSSAAAQPDAAPLSYGPRAFVMDPLPGQTQAVGQVAPDSEPEAAATSPTNSVALDSPLADDKKTILPPADDGSVSEVSPPQEHGEVTGSAEQAQQLDASSAPPLNDAEAASLTPDTTDEAPAAAETAKPEPALEPSVAREAPLPSPAATDGNPPAVAQPLSASQPLDGQAPDPPKKRSSPKLFITALLAILAAGSAFAFGYYLPNQPENVYSASLDRTGEALQQVLSQTTDSEQLRRFASSEISGSLEVATADQTYTAALTSRYDSGRSDSKLSINLTDSAVGSQNDTFDFELLTDKAGDQRYPDVYFRYQNIAAFGLDQFMPGLSQYDGRWIVVPASLIDEAAGELSTVEENDGEPVFTAEDASELAQITADVTNTYLFTSDEEVSVFQLQEYIGEETIDGDTHYRYRLDVNSNNAVRYCQVLSERIIRSGPYQRLSGATEEELSTAVGDAVAECDDVVRQSMEIASDFNLWANRRTKLVHKVGFTQQELGSSNEEKDSYYVEVGQNYQGGDEFALFFRSSQLTGEQRIEFTLTSNIETLNTDIEVNYADEIDDDVAMSETANLKLNIVPLTEPVKVDPPAGAIDFEQFMSELWGPAPDDDVYFSEIEVLGAANPTADQLDELRDTATDESPVAVNTLPPTWLEALFGLLGR
jgi:hypothetical protein